MCRLLALDQGQGTGKKAEPSANCTNVSVNLGIWISHSHVKCAVEHAGEHGYLSITVILSNLNTLADELCKLKDIMRFSNNRNINYF